MTTHCANCGNDNVAEYCARCGQRGDVALRPLTDWLKELFDSLTDLDLRALRTLRNIVFRPGQATRLYAAGQRASQTPPLRLYVVASAIVIAIMSFAGFFDSSTVTGIEDPELRQRFELLFPLLNFLAPLFIVPWLKLLFPKRLLQLHFVMALHYCTFIVVATSPLVLLLSTPQYLLVGQMLALLVSTVYLVVALRRCYQIGWWRAIASGGLATVGYYLTLALLPWGVIVAFGGT
ncbi:MAG: DUF3667 domain-containing protein [Gammaproteobacteria bacterium]|nr:DUF3667 domain-containing protein [Gammaproteobacteria bacterium]NND58880.1 DUF3667 domain-containing protein [Gammaproteobacteria bacterium]